MLAVPVFHDMKTESLRTCFIIFPGTGMGLTGCSFLRFSFLPFFFLRSSGSSSSCHDLLERTEWPCSNVGQLPKMERDECPPPTEV